MTPETSNPQRTDQSRAPRKSRRPASKKPWWLIGAVALLFIIAVISVGPLFTEKAPATALIKISKSATNETVADSLTKYFGRGYSDKIMRFAKMWHIDFYPRHGAFEIAKGDDALVAIIKLTRRGQTPVRVTINGFRSLDTLADRVASKMEFTPEELKEAATDPAFLKEYGLTPEETLALFIDETYEMYWTDTPRKFLAKVGDNYKNFWSPARVKLAEEAGVSPAGLATVASIVDEETNQKDEKGRVGRLYLNRLESGMRLQSDPTVRYALQDFTIRRVKSEHLKVDSPYNTYLYAGLPPGPIRTPNRATMVAVLKSPLSNDLYMCAREDFSGHHSFASDYAEHVKNALRYQRALDARGIK